MLTGLWKTPKENKAMVIQSNGLSERESIEHEVDYGPTESFVNQPIPSFSCNDPQTHLNLPRTWASVSGPAIMSCQSRSISLCQYQSALLNLSTTTTLFSVKSTSAILGSPLFHINFQISLSGSRKTSLEFFFWNYIVFTA